MDCEWEPTSWGAIATLEYGKALRSYRENPPGFEVFGTNGRIGWHDTALWDGPGVIVGRKGAYRGVHYTTAPYWVIDTAYSLQPKPEAKLDLRWAYYQIKCLDPNTVDDGSPIPSTTRSAFYVQPVLLPPLTIQTQVAELLGALDDKIELNRRMAETLEAMARALFRSWFIDFDPVQARAEGRSTGLPEEVESLFPDGFSANGLPETWTGTANDIAEIIRISVQPRDVEPIIPYIGLEHLERGSLTLYRHGFVSDVDSLKHQFKKGDLLFGKLRPYFNKVAIAPFDGLCSSDIFVFRARSGVPASLLYLSFSEPAFVATASNASSGTRMPRADWEYMRRLPIVLPQPTLAVAFEQTVRPLLERMIATAQERTALASLRDTLLPKLISGELRITDAEQRVAAA